MFITPYLTNPPVLSPEAILLNAGTLTDGTASGVAPYVVTLEGCDGIDVEVKISAGSASYRPYYWVPINKTGFANGGSWIALGADAIGGSGPASANIASYGGSCNGRYQHRNAKRQWILVREMGNPTEEWAKIEERRVVTEQS